MLFEVSFQTKGKLIPLTKDTFLRLLVKDPLKEVTLSNDPYIFSCLYVWGTIQVKISLNLRLKEAIFDAKVCFATTILTPTQTPHECLTVSIVVQPVGVALYFILDDSAILLFRMTAGFDLDRLVGSVRAWVHEVLTRPADSRNCCFYYRYEDTYCLLPCLKMHTYSPWSTLFYAVNFPNIELNLWSLDIYLFLHLAYAFTQTVYP